MSGDGFGAPGTTIPSYNPTTGATSATGSTSGATTGASSATATTPTTPSPTPLGSPPGLLQADNASSGFQLAAPTYGTNIMGAPSWVDDWAKAGSGDLNTYYQQHQGGYMDMTKPTATPDQLVFAPPPPPAPAAAPAAAAAAPAPQQAQGGWWAPKSGPAPAVTKNTLWGSSPVGQAELDALPDAFVASQSFLNQYGSSPGAQDYQKWRMGPVAYFDAQGKQAEIQRQMMASSQQSGR